MKLRLAIDQGNSSTKLSIFDDEKIVAAERHDLLTVAALDDLTKRFHTASAIYSSVVGNHNEIIELLKAKNIKCYVVDENLPLPIKIDYATPHTLGHDRIAVAVGAIGCHPGRNMLVVDSGTAITYDVVTADGHFRGGNIAPGINTRFEALSHYCAQLPLVDANGDVPMTGYDTLTAIRAGVVLGVVAEVTYMAKKLSATYGDDLTVMLTGGDSGIIAKRLEISNNVEINDNLVTLGLNRILKYNELL